MIKLYQWFPFLAPKFAGIRLGERVKIKSTDFYNGKYGTVVDFGHVGQGPIAYNFLIDIGNSIQWFKTHDVIRLTKLERAMK